MSGPARCGAARAASPSPAAVLALVVALSACAVTAGAAPGTGAECASGGVSGLAEPDSLSASMNGVTLAQVNAVASRLICMCGCGMVLSDCECSAAERDKAKIRTYLAEGRDPDEIVAIFVAADGEKRLAAPTKKGFNLVAWFAPFVALAAGGTFLGWVLRSWTRKPTASPPKPVRPLTPEQEAYKARLEEELRRGDR